MARPKKTSFLDDLACGNRGEALVVSELTKAQICVEINSGKKNREYDIKASYESFNPCTMEIKYDIYAARSGNIAIEFYNPKSNKPSGIDATLADYWVHVLTSPVSIWACRTSKLKVFLKETEPLKVITAGGDGNASLYLYKKEIILKEFNRLDEMDSKELVTFLFRR